MQGDERSVRDVAGKHHAVDTTGRVLRAFGRFWWDFVIGDTPELALATAAVVGLAFLVGGDGTIGAILLPLTAAGFLVLSTWRGRRRAPDH